MVTPIQHCRQILREKDYPRYLLSLTLPPKLREQLWVLGAFNVEISRSAEMSEAVTGAIRLKWWMDALQKPLNHPVVVALHGLNKNLAPLANAIEAREQDLEKGYRFATIKELDIYATATGEFWQLLAQSDEEIKGLQSLGFLWALQGLLWSTGYHLAQGVSTIPQEVATTHGTNILESSAEDFEALCHMVRALARRIEASLNQLSDSKTPLLLNRAVPFIRYRSTLMQNQPEIALAKHPADNRLTLLWQFYFAKAEM